jgi:hypothetical protein
MDHLDELGYNENPASGCNIWRNTSIPYYKELQQYLQELNDYYDRIENFTQVTKDVRRASQPNVCDLLELHPDGLAGIFYSSRQLSRLAGGYLEPALPPMRHPRWCLPPNPTKKGNYPKYLIDITYLVHDFKHMCQQIRPTSRTVLLDMGASLQFDFHKDDTPVVDLTSIYTKFGITFDHYYAYEIKPTKPDEVFQKLPDDLMASYHWINVGVSTDPQSKLNPWRLLLDNFDENDFIVVKLDVDNTGIELKLVEQLLADENIIKLVDVFYWEHHVSLKEWWPYSESAKKSLQLFYDLRTKGIPAHYWV